MSDAAVDLRSPSTIVNGRCSGIQVVTRSCRWLTGCGLIALLLLWQGRRAPPRAACADRGHTPTCQVRRACIQADEEGFMFLVLLSERLVFHGIIRATLVLMSEDGPSYGIAASLHLWPRSLLSLHPCVVYTE